MVRRRSKNLGKTRLTKVGRGKSKKGGLWRAFLYAGAILLLAYALIVISTVVRRAYEVKNANMLSEEASQRLLIEREGLKSRLFVLKSSHDQSIVGAWIVVSNEKLGSNLVY